MERFRGNVWLDGLDPLAGVRPRRPRGPRRRRHPARARDSSPAARRRRSIPIPASATPTPSARSRRAGATRTSASTPRWSRAGASRSAIARMPGRDLARPSPGGRAAPASASQGISYRQKSYRAVAGPRQQAGRKLLAAGTAAPAEGGRNGGRPPSGDRAGGALARLPEADAPPTLPHAAREMKVDLHRGAGPRRRGARSRAAALRRAGRASSRAWSPWTGCRPPTAPRSASPAARTSASRA